MTTTKTKTVHVTGSTKDEINASFTAAMKELTPTGKKRPAAATVARLHRESAEAFAKLPEQVPAGHQDAVVDEAARKLEAELNTPEFAAAVAKNDAALSGREVAKPDAVRSASGEVVDMAAKRATKAAKATKAPAAKATKAQAQKGEPPKAAEVNKGGRPPVDKFPYCPKCGFEFKTPQARCNSTAACEKRAAARTEPVKPPKAAQS